MTNSDPQPIAPQNMTPPPNAIPPQQPGEIGSPEQTTTWPKVVGVISIVLGSGACLSGGWGFAAPRFMKMMADLLPQDQAAPFTAMQEWSTWILISSSLTILIALVLLVTGIDLVRRRRRGIKLGRIWAVLKMIFAVCGTVIGFVIQKEQFLQMSEQLRQQNAPIDGSVLVVFGAVGAVFGILWACVYPVFLLIWFSRAKVKAEYVQWP